MKTYTLELWPDEFLRVTRSRLEMTQTQLAQRLGVSRQMVNYYEKGVVKIPPMTLETVQLMAETEER